MTSKMDSLRYAWVCVYASVDEKGQKGKLVRKHKECLKKFRTGRRVLV